MESARHWFEVVRDVSLRQGDIFQHCTGFWLPEDYGADSQTVSEASGTWSILNASCDLDHKKMLGVLLAKVDEASATTLKAREGEELQKRLEAIRRGHLWRLFMLPQYEGEVSLPLSVVSFQQQILIPQRMVEEWAARGPRLRLRHPYREQFGNWVAARFGAVGPEDEGNIPTFYRLQDHHVLEADDG